MKCSHYPSPEQRPHSNSLYKKGGRAMKEYEDAASTCLSQAPASRSHRRRRLLLGSLVLAFAFMFTVGVGLSTGATRAQALESRGTSSFQTLVVSDKGTPHNQQGTTTAALT